MKKPIATTVLALGLAAGNAHAANETSDQHKWLGAATFTGGAVVGALVGGPVGMLVGALGGGLHAEQQAQVETTRASLAASQRAKNQLEQEIALQEAQIAELEEKTMARLKLKVFFKTGIDQVSEQDQQRLQAVADYLARNPDFDVRLEGHADPRGTDEYNAALSRERAETVETLLMEAGIAEGRIRTSHHGSALSRAADGDLKTYARERRVEINLTPREKQEVTRAAW